MKNKFLITIFTILLLISNTYSVSASSLIPNLFEGVNSQPPKVFFSEINRLEGYASMPFDYGKIAFTTNDNDEKRILGKNNIKRLALSYGYDTEKKVHPNTWFSVYALNDKFYPEYGLYTYDFDIAYEEVLKQAIITYLYNNEKLKDKLYFEEYNVLPEVEYSLEENKTHNEVTDALLNNKEIKVYLKSLTYKINEEKTKIVTSKELFNEDIHELKIKLKDSAFNQYSESKNKKEYNHSMWITDHSYPTLNKYELYSILNKDSKLINKTLVTNNMIDTRFKMLKDDYQDFLDNYNNFNKKVSNKQDIKELDNVKIESNNLIYKSDSTYQNIKVIFEFVVNDKEIGNYDLVGIENMIDNIIPKDLYDKYIQTNNKVEYESHLNEYYQIEKDSYNDYLEKSNTKLENNKKININIKKSGTYYLILNLNKDQKVNFSIKPSYTKELINEISSLEDIKSLEEYEYYIDNYLYATTQYAIYKVNNVIPNLGDTLEGSVELNKLYNYLIKDRKKIDNYDSYEYINKLYLEEPDATMQLYKQTQEDYIYGPYLVETDLLNVNQIKIEIINEDLKDSIKIVDENLNEKSIVHLGEQFFIQTKKEQKVSSAQIKVLTTDATLITDKSKKYDSTNNYLTDLVSSSKVTNKKIENTYELYFKPKTKAENVAIVLVITLVAFSLGYLVLNYKSKNMEI